MQNQNTDIHHGVTESTENAKNGNQSANQKCKKRKKKPSNLPVAWGANNVSRRKLCIYQFQLRSLNALS